MKLTVFTAANRRYEQFVLPYVASVLHHEPAAEVEIRMEAKDLFEAECARPIGLLRDHFAHRFVLTDGDFTRLPANSIRFVETPTVKSEFVYIGDIDILVLEPIMPDHLAHMSRTGLPYSNVQRPGKPSLTGLHFSRWDAFYPHAPVPNARPNLDEAHLYSLVQARGLPMPDAADTFRPIHGFHMSLNRDPRQPRNGWGGINHEPYAASYSEYRSTDLWLQLAPMLHASYQRMLFVLEVQLADAFPEIMSKSKPSPMAL